MYLPDFPQLSRVNKAGDEVSDSKEHILLSGMLSEWEGLGYERASKAAEYCLGYICFKF